MSYRADIDGLRAVAVAPVVLFHLGVPGFSGGYVGVDIFFVISGFVIGRSLLADLESGTFSIAAFYERRIRRIFPALFAVVLTTWLVASVMLLPQFFLDFSKSLMASSVFGSNIYFWLFSSYFSEKAATRPLLHTWSLSVEEQYYIFAPILTFVTYQFFQRRWLLIFAPLFFLSLGLSVVATSVMPTGNFFILPTRAWELLLGAILAHSGPHLLGWAWVSEIAAFGGVTLITYAVAGFTETTPFPGVNALFPCLGAALIIYAGMDDSALTRHVLASRPFVGVGKISYSLYLIHWPLIVFVFFYTLGAPNAWQKTLILVSAGALSFLSWRFVEQPFRANSFRWPRSKIMNYAAAVAIASCVLGLIGVVTEGLAIRFPDYTDRAERGTGWRKGQCFFMEDEDSSSWNGDLCTATRGGANRVMIWGDSFAAQYVPGLIRNGDRIPYTILQYTRANCPPSLAYRSHRRPLCEEFNARALDIIRSEKIGVVVLAAKWLSLMPGGLGQILSTLDALEGMGLQYFVIGLSPGFTVDVDVLAYTKGRPDKVDKWDIYFDPAINDRLRSIVGREHFIDPLSAQCEGTLCPYRDRGAFLFDDEEHYSPEGSARAVAAYFPLLNKEPAKQPAPSH